MSVILKNSFYAYIDHLYVYLIWGKKAIPLLCSFWFWNILIYLFTGSNYITFRSKVSCMIQYILYIIIFSISVPLSIQDVYVIWHLQYLSFICVENIRNPLIKLCWILSSLYYYKLSGCDLHQVTYFFSPASTFLVLS